MEFELTNEQRPYFGLDLIQKTWDKVELKKGIWIFFKGDVIKKVIQLHDRGYSEHDYELKTNKRKALLPKTAKGKEKPLTLSNLEAFQPVNFSFTALFDRRDDVYKSSVYEATIRNRNHASSKEVPMDCNTTMKTFAKLTDWVEDFVRSSTPDYAEELTLLKNKKKLKVKYQAGDIFTFPLSRNTYGLGKILFPLEKLRDKNILSPASFLYDIMQVPLLVRLYALEIPCKNILKTPEVEASDLKGKRMLPAYFMADNNILRGEYPIVAHAELIEEDLDFPISYDLYENTLSWGLGTITGLPTLKSEIDRHTQGVMLRNAGVSSGASTDVLRKFLNGEEPYYEYEICHSKNRKLYDEVFRAAGLIPTITYDEFCKKANAPDKREFISYKL